MGKEYHIGIVTRNIEKASGITSFQKTALVSSQELMGAVYFRAETLYDGEYPVPADPPFMYASIDGAGDFVVPKVGDTIMIEMDNSLDLPEPRWLYSLYTTERKIHRDFAKNYPFRLGRITNSGHKFVFDDKEKEEQIYLEHKTGSRFNFKKDGSFVLDIRKITSRDTKDEESDKFDPDWFNLFTDNTEKQFKLRYQLKDTENFFEMLWDRKNNFAHRVYQPTSDAGIHFKELWDWANKKCSYKFQFASGEFAEIEIDGTAKKFTIKDHHANTIVLDNVGTVITDKNTNKVTMDSAGIVLLDKNTNKVTMDSAGITLLDKTSNKVEMTSSGVKATGTGSAVVNLSSGKVALGASAGEVVDLLSQTLDALSQSLGNLGYPLSNSAQFISLKAMVDAIKGSV